MSNKLCLVLSVLLTATMLLAACRPRSVAEGARLMLPWFNQRPLRLPLCPMARRLKSVWLPIPAA